MMTEVYHFGRFTLDPVEHRLRADGAPVSLGSTAFTVLLALVERAGSIVTKDDLISRVWGYSDVEENRLYVHINALRKIIGRECIVNKQGRGYRFEAQVWRSGKEMDKPARRPDGNLPAPWTAAEGPTRLIGRDKELPAVTELLARAQVVTLAGPGGVGKTRLAVRAAGESAAKFPDGVWLVELGALTSPDLVPGAVAAALGVRVGHSETPLATLAHDLRLKTLLIVLDNCEHLHGVCAELCETLAAAAPGVKLLATSREALSCAGEQIFEVPPLDVPREGADATHGVASVELFVERASAADARFRLEEDELSIAANICRRLDGLPLAIEMVASWAGVLGLRALDEKLESSRDVWLRARTTAPRRHSTLSSALEWSHDLLEAPERILLRRLAVFPAGFALGTAEAVASDEPIPEARVFEYLGSLVRKSMLAVEPGWQARRYRLLDTTRAFMREKLASSGEEKSVRLRHARYVLQSLEAGMDEWETTGDAVWLERFGPLLDDVRTALDWAMQEEGDDAVALAGVSWPLWRQLSLHVEGRQWLGRAAGRLTAETPPMLEARLRFGMGELALGPGLAQAAYGQYARAAALYRSHGRHSDLGAVLPRLAFALLMTNRPKDAEQASAEALELLEHGGQLRTLATAYSVSSCIEARLGRFDLARTIGEKAEQLCLVAGAERSALVVATNLVEVSAEMEDFDRAVSDGRALVARLRATSHSALLAYALYILAAALVARSDVDEALAAAREALPALSDEGMLCCLLDHLALRSAVMDRIADAALLAGYADAIYGSSGRTRGPIEQRALKRLDLYLRDALADQEAARLKREGALLTEEQAIRLATSG